MFDVRVVTILDSMGFPKFREPAVTMSCCLWRHLKRLRSRAARGRQSQAVFLDAGSKHSSIALRATRLSVGSIRELLQIVPRPWRSTEPHRWPANRVLGAAKLLPCFNTQGAHQRKFTRLPLCAATDFDRITSAVECFAVDPRSELFVRDDGMLSRPDPASETDLTKCYASNEMEGST